MSLAEQESAGILERLGVAVSRTGLALPVDLTYDDFSHVCAFVGAMHNATNWWIADAFIQGEKLFGDDVYQAAELLHRSPSTIQNIVSIGRKVPPTRRRENVDFTHHGEVAPLTPNEQRHWLKVAENEQLTKSQLRDRIHAERNGDVLPPVQEICESCGRPL